MGRKGNKGSFELEEVDRKEREVVDSEEEGAFEGNSHKNREEEEGVVQRKKRV